jgi:hypothetical protein
VVLSRLARAECLGALQAIRVGMYATWNGNKLACFVVLKNVHCSAFLLFPSQILVKFFCRLRIQKSGEK